MKKEYSFCCRNCWHTWISKLKRTQCPKCKSFNLDVDTELIWE